MERKTLFGTGLSTVAGLALLALLIDQGIEPERKVAGNQSEEFQKLPDGTRYTVHPSELRQGCPSMDCIPSIDDPTFVAAEEAGWLNPEDRVIGVEMNGESRAYPLRILALHEIVNDRIGGEPIVVTYCPLCRSGVTYSRVVENETLEFGVSGKLYNANLVMYDRSTETYWSQIGGKAIVGPRVPRELELKFSSVTKWKKWQEEHPETKVLSRNTGIYPESSYDRNPYAGYKTSGRVGFGVGEVDDRLPAKELVLGIKLSGETKAYPEETVREQGIIQDTVGGEPVVILERPDGTIAAFVRRSGGETLNFSIRQEGLEDSKDRLWSFDGELENGSRSLDSIVPQGFYWFAWSKFHPDTQVYKQAERG